MKTKNFIMLTQLGGEKILIASDLISFIEKCPSNKCGANRWHTDVHFSVPGNIWTSHVEETVEEIAEIIQKFEEKG